VTIGAVLTVATVAVVSGSLFAPLSARDLRSVGAGVGLPPAHLLTAALWCSGPAGFLLTTVLLLLLAAAERRLGRSVTVAMLVGGQLLAAAAALALIRLLADAGDAWARELSRIVVVGPSAGVLAVVALSTARTSALWRRRTRVLGSIVLVAFVLYLGSTADIVRLAGWLIGLGAAAFLRTAGRSTSSAYVTRREARALVALVVAVTAAGPLLAAMGSAPDGPWAVLSHLFVSARPGHGMLRAVCGHGGDPADCRVLQARARLTGRGPTLLTVLPVAVQLVLAEGLRRGRRAAWGASVTLTAALTVVGGWIVLTVLRTPTAELPLLAARPGSLPAVSLAAPFVVPLAVLVLLLLTRELFAVHAAAGTVRRWIAAAGAGLAMLAGLYVALGSLMSKDWAAAPSPADLLGDLPWRMLPPGYLGEVLAPLVPRDEGTRLLAGWTGVAAWLVVFGTAVRLVRPRAPAGDAGRARALVDRHGDGPLSFMATWPGNRYWFLPDGSAMVAYRVLGGVALTTGDPVGEPSVRSAAVAGFTDFCADHGWTPCWYSVTDDTVRALESTGGQRLQVAAETWLPLGDLAFTGRRWQDVRTALNRAAREGVQARWVRWSRAPLGLREQVARLSEEWLSDKGLPEMGFTLGGLDELADDAVRCLLAVGPDGSVQAVTSWLPARRDGAVVGWTIDVMRRARIASPGIMEFLIGTAALTFQEEGAAWVSLSGAPLALPESAADAGMPTRVLELAGQMMESVYGFRSLLAFKAKFRPRYRPLWLVYPAASDLPRIARAVSSAYLPDMSPGQAVRLARALVFR
jgi:lysylphosphatidylglycerol synthetase-like protein (DUF2156 family)